jgi:tRNA-uridine 2-sulfurtransferase
MKNKDIKVVVAMSGGVDSSVAAALLKEKGYNVIGITMQIWPGGDRSGSCCSLSAVEDARRVANKLGIPFYVLNFKDIFKRTVIDNFISEYEKGRTPNPCVVCNEKIKFEALLKKAEELDADYIATGHYAKVVKKGNRYFLLKGKDGNKDQSYFLYPLSQHALSKTMFPLGDLTKPQVRILAKKFGLKVAEKPESQEICFVEGSISDFFEPKQGNIVDMNGKVIGKHKGYQVYTIGQRKGLGIASAEPLYVVKIDPKKNEITAGNKGDVYGDDCIVGHLNLIEEAKLTRKKPVKACIRYRNPVSPAQILPLSQGKIRVMFKKPQFAITPGQSIVFYDGNVVFGGGIIDKAIKANKAIKAKNHE